MAQSTASNIKRKIQTLKDELDMKDKEISDLKGKVKAAEERADAAELEARNCQQKYTSMEEKLDQTEDKLYDATKVLEGLKSDREDKERELKKYMGQEEASVTRLEHQSYELKEAKDIAQMADYKYEEIARKLVVLTTELELAEKRVEEAEAHEEESRRMMHLTLRCMKPLKLQLEKLYDVETSSEERISLLQSKLEQMEDLYQEKSRECDRLSGDVDKLQEQLDGKEKELEEMKKDMESTLADLSGI